MSERASLRASELLMAKMAVQVLERAGFYWRFGCKLELGSEE